MKLLTILIMAMSISCGRNIFAPYEKSDPPKDATVAMEQGKPELAIRILKDALEDDPDNYQLIALLAAATAQKYGIDAISLALEMASNSANGDSEEGGESSGDSSTNGITALFGALPAPDDTTIAGVESAIEIYTTIPAEMRTTANNFYLTLLNTALLGLRTKKLDTDGDGQLSPVELLSLDDDSAVGILSSLLSAEEALAGGIANGNSSASAESISKIKEAIESQEGETDAEKLRNYLNSQKTT